MTNPTPAPRLCTLWGSTFDARNAFVNRFQNKVSVCRFIEDYCLDVIAFKEGEDWSGATPFYHEAMDALHHALHPPLCMEHALEEVGGKPRYDFSVAGEFIVANARTKMFVQYYSKNNVFLDSRCNEYELENFNWFTPDVYSDAESMVNAWEGE